MTTKQDIRNDGFRRGQCIASWTDLPEIGVRIRPDIDWIGLGDHVTGANQYDYWEACCCDQPCEMPEEYESLAKPYDVWEVFKGGVEAGIAAYGREHHRDALAAASSEG